jgi:hypothetical protein
MISAYLDLCKKETNRISLYSAKNMRRVKLKDSCLCLWLLLFPGLIITFQIWLYYFNEGFLKWYLVLIYTFVAIAIIVWYPINACKYNTNHYDSFLSQIKNSNSNLKIKSRNLTIQKFKNDPYYIQLASDANPNLNLEGQLMNTEPLITPHLNLIYIESDAFLIKIFCGNTLEEP